MRRQHLALAMIVSAAVAQTPAHGSALPIVPAPGVHRDHIDVGTILDLSGPLAAQGRAIENGLKLAFSDINAKGGVNGRKIVLLVKNSAYNPQQARNAAEALLHHGIFAVLCANGTPPVAASMPLILGHNILSLFPFVPARADYTRPRRLAFSLEVPVAAQAEIGLKALLNERGNLKVGVLFSEDSLGRAVLAGVQRELARRNAPLTAAVPYIAGSRTLTAPLQQLRREGAELVVLGSVPQEAMRALQDAHRALWRPVFFCPACYMPEAATIGGRDVDGLYAFAATPIPYPNGDAPAIAAWARLYARRFHAVATPEALQAYLDGELFAVALQHSGSHPTPLYFADVLESLPPWHDRVLGGPVVKFSASDHLGLHSGWLAEVENRRWRMIGPIHTLTPRPHSSTKAQ
ncbi:MAG: ABC transporter substrate-binding protein [Alphaproteobacteria bacterium]|nr:ABC transporter substrate-binding protein [Alphaproteobacteria bacterium]